MSELCDKMFCDPYPLWHLSVIPSAADEPTLLAHILQLGGVWNPLVLETGLTLVCSFLSCLMSARFSLSFALSSRSCPTTSDVLTIHDLIALSLLRWASIICGKQEVMTRKQQLQYDKKSLTINHSPKCTEICYCSHYCHTHRFIELFACLCGIHFA